MKYTLKDLEFDRAANKCYDCHKGYKKNRNYAKHLRVVHGGMLSLDQVRLVESYGY